jgi:PAS domain S-box-containing protein
MAPNPTYEELEQKLSDLEREKEERQKAESALRESEEKYRTVVENSLAGIYVIQDGRFQYVNPRFVEMLGYARPRELVGMDFERVIHAKDRPRIRSRDALVEQGLKLGTRQSFRAVKKDGSIIWVDMRDTHTQYMGKPANVGNVIDITEQRVAEESLRQSEEKYRSILEHIEEGYYEVDIRGNLTFFNDSFCRIWGYPREQLMGMNNRDYTGEENARRTYQTFNRVYTTGEPAKAFDWEITRKDGGRKNIELSVSLMTDTLGRRIGFRGIVRDITERKVAEEELDRYRHHLEELVEARTAELTKVNERFQKEIDERRRVEESLRSEKNFSEALIASLPGILYVFDRKGRFLKWNKNLEHVSGYAAREITEMSALDFFQGKDRENVEKRVKEVFRRGKSTVEADITPKTGRRIPYFFTGLRTVIDGATYLVGVGIDITEKRALEAETMRAAHLAALGELAAGVAHEINNPINGIINYGQILIDEAEEQGQSDRIPRRIITEGERVAVIVKNLLSFARDAKEEHVPDLIHEILAEGLSLVERQILKDGIHMKVDVTSDLPRVRAMRQQIQQVILNILSNARYALNQKYPGAHKDKVLEIRGEVARGDGRKVVRLRFRDRGTGIPNDILDKICDPFFSTKPRGEGTGLGLSISYGIMKDHNGRLWFRSKEGRYTEAILDIPIAEVRTP